MRSMQDVLTEDGVDLEGWRLYSARQLSADGSVVMGCAYKPDQTIVEWIARCVASCTVLTNVDIGRSFAALAAMGDTGNLYLDGTFEQLGAAMGHGGPGTYVSMQGSYDSDPTSAAALSISHRADDGLVAGLSLGAAGIETPLAFGGTSFFTSASATASIGHEPSGSGFDWRASASLAGLSGSVDRNYLNGNTIETSRGDTSGIGAGAEIELGYRIADIAPALSLRPYLGVSVLSTHYAGYNESGGSAPASLSAFTSTQGLVRAGIEAEQAFEGGFRL